MIPDDPDAHEAGDPARADDFTDGPTSEAVARYKMIAAGAARILAVAFAAIAAAWICAIVVEGIIDAGFWGYLGASAASAAVLLLAAWILWHNADSLSGLIVKAPAPGRCPACGFDLAGVAEGRCPECGVRRTRIPARLPSYAVWHSALVVALRAVAVFMLLWAANTWLGWLSYVVSDVNVWPSFSWSTAVATGAAKLVPPILLWRWAPSLGRRVLRGCAVWEGATRGS